MQHNTNATIQHWQALWLQRFWDNAPMARIAQKRLTAMNQAQHKDIMADPKNPAMYSPDEAVQAARRVYDFYHSRAVQAFEHIAALDLATLDELQEMRRYL